ncbi:hypothetical protein CLCR_11262 [Cladophialophora carrionii]|uniref:Uncharacterized protein n=1 Tax=Cladophialophora carrionii TaxID=86049 RepID=A0A1C1CF98_9EURO|nr:hypothetical protein CLCR_11262 [Cladophialophora carrionii]
MASVKDWAALTKARHTSTTEQLLQFNAAGVDPYLIQVAELIGSQVNISLPGPRNLVIAFSSLPQAEFSGQRMGIGFSDRHIVRILAESNGGFAFLGILSCLGEYFASDVIVAVIMKLASNLQTDGMWEGWEPSDSQWKRLVHLCQGLLATSPFGTLISRNHEDLRTGTDHVNVAQIVEALVNMSDLVGGGAKNFSLEHAASDAYWFAAVAEYLFDLRVAAEDPDGVLLYARPGTNAKEAQFVFQSDVPVYSDEAAELVPLSEAFADIGHIRVQLVVETILELGFYIARTVVIPNLFPKRAGVLVFYERLHAARLIYRAQEAPATEAFLKGFVAALPTPRHLIETMCLLVTGSVPNNLLESSLSISHEGITVSMNAWNPNSGVRDPENEHVVIRQRAGVNVSTGSSHLNGRIFDHGYWVLFDNKNTESDLSSFSQILNC